MAMRLLFQPSEESFDEDDISGAMAMIADGALDGVDHTLSLHVASQLASGKTHFQDGYARAASDTFEAWIRGTGSHAATPHAGIDPIYLLAPVLTAIYAIPSRRIHAQRPAVVSVGQVHGGTASNVIPDAVYLEGTMRSYDADVRLQLRTELENALRIVEPLGGSYDLRIRPAFGALYNDPIVNQWVREVSAELIGAENVVEWEFGMGSEDFAFMAAIAPGVQFLVGAACPMASTDRTTLTSFHRRSSLADRRSHTGGNGASLCHWLCPIDRVKQCFQSVRFCRNDK